MSPLISYLKSPIIQYPNKFSIVSNIFFSQSRVVNEFLPSLEQIGSWFSSPLKSSNCICSFKLSSRSVKCGTCKQQTNNQYSVCLDMNISILSGANKPWEDICYGKRSCTVPFYGLNLRRDCFTIKVARGNFQSGYNKDPPVSSSRLARCSEAGTV